MVDVNSMKKELVVACKTLHKANLTDSYGHIALRIPDEDRFLLTPRKSPGVVSADDILMLDLEGNIIEGSSKVPNEKYIYTSIFKKRRDMLGIVHSHTSQIVVLSVVGEQFKPLSNYGVVFHEGVPIYEKTCLIDSVELGEHVADLLGTHRAIVLKGHGAVVVGEDLKTVCTSLFYLNEASKLQIEAMKIGTPRFLSKEEILLLAEKVLNPGTVQRVWEYLTDGVVG